ISTLVYQRSSTPRLLPSFSTRRSSDLNSTMRIAFLHASPINTTSPTWTKMLLSPPVSHTPTIAESTHIGTMRMTARGRMKLSYRSEEHTSELQSLTNLVCRLLLQKQKT